MSGYVTSAVLACNVAEALNRLLAMVCVPGIRQHKFGHTILYITFGRQPFN